MKLNYPSPEFDDAVAAVCHGDVSDEQAAALNELLRADGNARDEYILRVEIHARLASEDDLYIAPAPEQRGEARRFGTAPGGNEAGEPPDRRSSRQRWWWTAGVAAGLVLATIAGWWRRDAGSAAVESVPTSRAVAMLDQTIDARWETAHERPRLGAPLDPGWLKLESGLARIVFYRGARVVVEGPAEIKLVSSGHAEHRSGRLTAEVPAGARGFKIDTPQGTLTDLGSCFGLEVTGETSAVHVFDGRVSWQAAGGAVPHILAAGEGAVTARLEPPQFIAAKRSAFGSLLDVGEKLIAEGIQRFDRWRAAGDVLNEDPTLRVRFEFGDAESSSWQLRNAARGATQTADATIVGCQFAQGRWPGKRALEFRSVNDRVRMNVPGEFEAVTLAAWVQVQGLDRQLNALFMSDGFSAGTLHWLIRKDGVLGLTVVGEGAGNYQIVASPPELTLDQFGLWVHLAVVVDGPGGKAAHYVNGRLVSESSLRIAPPYRVGTAELGNWHGKGFPTDDPFMIRNFSGTMDEFCLFGRPLDAREIRALYMQGRPELDAVALRE